MRTTNHAAAGHLGSFLDELVAQTDHLARRESDPIGLVHRYQAPEDREVAALIASCLAYGRVDLLRRAVATVFDVLGDHPALAVTELRADILEDFVYRMTRGPDLYDLFTAVARVRADWGSLEACYADGDGTHLERAIRLVERLHERRHRRELARGFRYLLPNPADGSTTKRLHMFFRWMVRGPDEVDFGQWTAVTPAELIMPLDTHTSRLCRYLGLTSRKATDLRTAIEVTDALRALRPDDPLVYDFALAHLGISGSCIHRRSEEHCPGCPIEAVCGL